MLLFPSCADDAVRDVDAGAVVDAGSSDSATPDAPIVNDAGASNFHSADVSSPLHPTRQTCSRSLSPIQPV